jgi:hypothetical protein
MSTSFDSSTSSMCGMGRTEYWGGSTNDFGAPSVDDEIREEFKVPHQATTALTKIHAVKEQGPLP